MATGTYLVFGQTLPIEPTDGGWIPQRQLGRTGAGFETLSPVFSFEITWGLLKKSEFSELMSIYYSTSGSFVPCSLPEFDSATYEFYGYTGCVVNKPTFGKYFVETVTNVRLLITNIDVSFFRTLAP